MNRNKLFFLLLSAASLFVAGCKEDKCKIMDDVDGTVLPDECYDCQWYAPDSASLSATDYNTVTQARDFFTCHRETLKEHDGDTLKLVGWLYWGNAPEFIPEYMHGQEYASDMIYLTDREDHLGEHQIFSVKLSAELKERFREQYDELLGKKWYVSGILRGLDFHTGGCCTLNPELFVFKFDTINTLEP